MVNCIRYHPSAENILSVGHRTGTSVLDLETSTRLYDFAVSGFGKDSVSHAWNADGSNLAVLGKNNSLNVFDPRTAAAEVLQKFTTPSIKKTHHVLYIGSAATEYLLLFGIGGTQRPVIQWYDPRNMGSVVNTTDLDFSNGCKCIPLDRASCLHMAPHSSVFDSCCTALYYGVIYAATDTMPLYDRDINMLYVTTRVSSSIAATVRRYHLH